MTLFAAIPAGALGFDALGDPAPPDTLAADGWRFRTLYIAPSSRMSTKITNATRHAAPARIERHHDAGVGILLNFESSATRFFGGEPAGRSDGAWSADLCHDLGYPAGLPVLVSFDSETRAGGRVASLAIAYGHAFATALGTRWPIGIYGGTPIMHELAAINTLGWKAMASSWSSGSWPNAVVHMQQRRPTAAETERMPYATKFTLDVNVVVKPFAVWLPGVEPAPPAEPVVIEPPPPAPPPVVVRPPVPSQGVSLHMIPIDYGIAGTDPWWTEMAMTMKGLEWSGGPTAGSQLIRAAIVKTNPPRADRLRNDDEVVALIEQLGTFGPCPSTFVGNARLAQAWAAHSNG